MREHPVRRLEVLTFVLGAFALELFLVLPLLVRVTAGGAAPAFSSSIVSEAILAHVAAALLCGLAFWRPSPEHGRPRLAALAFWLALAFPVAGVLWSLALLVMGLDVSAALPSIREYRKLVDVMLPPQRAIEDVRHRYLDCLHRVLAAGPFHEFVAHQSDPGSLEVAFRSVRLLPRPSMFRSLTRALESPLPETRAYATAALARLETELDRELVAAQRNFESRPGDPAAALRLADARLAYADEGSTDDPVIQFHLMAAVGLFRKVIPRLDGNVRDRAREKLARALCATSQSLRAADLYLELVAEGVSQLSLLVGCLEACLRAGRMTDLARTLAIAKARCPEALLIGNLSSVWVGGEAS